MSVQGQAESGAELLQWHLDVAKEEIAALRARWQEAVHERDIARAEVDRLRIRLRVHGRERMRAEQERDAARARAQRDEALASIDDCALSDMADNGCHYVRITGRRRGEGPDAEWGFVWEFEAELDDGIHSDNGTHDLFHGALSDLLNATYAALPEDVA